MLDGNPYPSTGKGILGISRPVGSQHTCHKACCVFLRGIFDFFEIVLGANYYKHS